MYPSVFINIGTPRLTFVQGDGGTVGCLTFVQGDGGTDLENVKSVPKVPPHLNFALCA